MTASDLHFLYSQLVKFPAIFCQGWSAWPLEYRRSGIVSLPRLVLRNYMHCCHKKKKELNPRFFFKPCIFYLLSLSLSVGSFVLKEVTVSPIEGPTWWGTEATCQQPHEQIFQAHQAFRYHGPHWLQPQLLFFDYDLMKDLEPEPPTKPRLNWTLINCMR